MGGKHLLSRKSHIMGLGKDAVTALNNMPGV